MNESLRAGRQFRELWREKGKGCEVAAGIRAVLSRWLADSWRRAPCGLAHRRIFKRCAQDSDGIPEGRGLDREPWRVRNAESEPAEA